MTNHPIHIQDEDEGLSPTALVPFCEFGDKMSGVEIPQMNFPVCNGFKARIIRDQLCYTLDLNDYKKKFNFNDKTKISLSLFIDYNEDRQLKKKDYSNEQFITINTVGKELGNYSSVHLLF